MIMIEMKYTLDNCIELPFIIFSGIYSLLTLALQSAAVTYWMVYHD